MPNEPRQLPTAPVSIIPRDVERPEPVIDGIALCLSGGGYRAMLFHLGALWRLNEFGYLPKLNRVSSVSGGSITAGILGVNWQGLRFDKSGVATEFSTAVVKPLRSLASITVDLWSGIIGIITPGVTISERVANAYAKYLFGSKTLQDLPDEGPGTPRFVFNATNVQSGALWRFAKPYMADWRVGRVMRPTTPLAVAVAASSAFPPFLSPAHLSLEPGQCVKNPGNFATGDDLHKPPYTTEVILTDGGVYDNLGLETAWKSYQTVLVSDGGGKMDPVPDPPADWASHSKRVLELIDNQVRSLRKRQLIDSYQLPVGHEHHRNGTYWGVRTDVADYHLDAAPNYPFTPAACPHEKTLALANVATRLASLDDTIQERLINWGYAVTDVAMRTHVDSTLPLPLGLPYKMSGLG
jgi:NTE family protein